MCSRGERTGSREIESNYRISSLFNSYSAVKLYISGKMQGWKKFVGKDTTQVISICTYSILACIYFDI